MVGAFYHAEFTLTATEFLVASVPVKQLNSRYFVRLSNLKGKLFLGQYLIWVLLLLGQLHGYKSCVQKERNALFDLKKFLISITQEGYSNSNSSTWTNGTASDCCRWEGVKCNRTSKRIIELSIGSPKLKVGYLLNLSLLHPFEEVRSVGVSSSGFNGFFDAVDGYKSLRRLRNLEILDLSDNAFRNSIFPFLSAAPSLTTLFIRDNNMEGPFPSKELKDLTNLELLDLSRNRFDSYIPIQDSYGMVKLKALDLSANEFSGAMELQGICKLKKMQELDLSENKLVGEFPLCLTNLTGLRVLDLSSNHLTGKLPPALSNLDSLQYLSLLNNDFEGFFSLGLLTNLSKLKVFKLSSTSNSLQVMSESSWKPKFQLRVIALPSCNLEKVPQFLIHQKDLRQVDLSGNNISGIFPSRLLANNTKLRALLLQNNSFTTFQLPESPHGLIFLDVSVNEFNHPFPENIGWILPRLQYMNISKNGFDRNLPSSLGNMKGIKYMDLSHNSFHGKLPRSFVNGCYSLDVLKLSHNKLSGEIFPVSTNFASVSLLTMDNNQFTGKIGQGLRSFINLELLDISNNNLTGVIPSWIGELPLLYELLLSNNLLEGEIPISLFNRSSHYLLLLDISANILSGDIPQHVNSTYPLALFLQDNNISGVIPDTLIGNVQILDLSNNRLSGNIPEFANTEKIITLLLRGNNLTGRIPHQLCGLRNIQLLNLSNNRLNGSIPSCLSNTSFGLGKEVTSYYYDFGAEGTTDGFFYVDVKSLLMLDSFGKDYTVGTPISIEFETKHRYDSYMGGNLQLLFGMDLSENELSGEIPVELGNLQEIQSLNLSHNKLSGVIPESFSGMKNVESLDLSFNGLQGRIPPQLTDLNSLSTFNVSYNNLSGIIPQGKQFNTFDTQSFLGNPLLRGQQTNRNCSSFQEADNGVKEDESRIDMVSFYWSFGAAYVTILVGIFASLSFDSPWSRFWFYIVEAFIHKARHMLW